MRGLRVSSRDCTDHVETGSITPTDVPPDRVNALLRNTYMSSTLLIVIIVVVALELAVVPFADAGGTLRRRRCGLRGRGPRASGPAAGTW